jgi:HD-GYP domain-containing protein (c-di-GMP phosphodiesterase class II)
MLEISQEIITKPGRLSFEEFKQIKKHPGDGLELLKRITDMPQVTSEVIIQHHEKFNGKGYPEGKNGNEISKYAQIVGIAEVYEALTHARPYRKSRIIPFKAVKIIVQDENDSFYPEILKAFLNYVTFYPIGSYVRLNSDEIGKVISVNKNVPLRPVVEIIQDPDGNPVEEKKQIDLARSQFLYIEKALDENEALPE